MPVIINPKAKQDWHENGKLEMYNDFLIANPLKSTQEQMGLWADDNESNYTMNGRKQKTR